jgi:apolipoprotein N-acyltransferase
MGYSFGILCFGAMIYGIIPYSIIAYLLSTFILSLFPVLILLTVHLFYKYLKNQVLQLFAVPIFWVALEYIGAKVYMPLNHGLFLADHTYLIQISDITGCYGISFLIWMVNQAIAITSYNFKNGYFFKKNLKIFIIISGIFIAVFYYGKLSIRNSSDQISKELKIAVLQGSVRECYYTNSRYYPFILDKTENEYFDLTTKAMAFNPDIIVWPETAIGINSFRIPEVRQRLYNVAKAGNCHLLIGSLDLDENLNRYNSIFFISPTKGLIDRFDKTHLIPYFENFFTPGNQIDKVFHSDIGNFGGMICYESAFNHIAQAIVNKGAEALFILADDGGMKQSTLPLLHKATIIFRAVENKRYTVYAANSGISMIIDPYGRIIKQTKLFEKAILKGKIKLSSQKTLFSRYGNFFSVICLILTVLMLAYIFQSARNKSRK